MPNDPTPSLDPLDGNLFTNQVPLGSGVETPIPPSPSEGADVEKPVEEEETDGIAFGEIADVDPKEQTLDEPAHQVPENDERSTAAVTQEKHSAGLMGIVETLLKSPAEVIQRRRITTSLLVIFASCHLIYGLICGSFAGDLQWVAAPLKIVCGTMIAGLLCLPSLYIFACLSGARIRIADACQLLFGALALTSLLLLGFAPVAFIFTFSVQSLTFMGIIHLAIWMLSIGFGIRFVLRGVEAKKSDTRNRLPRPEGSGVGIMGAWAIVFMLTLLQMSTTLRPILGSADKQLSTEKKFFLVHWSESLEQEMND